MFLVPPIYVVDDQFLEILFSVIPECIYTQFIKFVNEAVIKILKNIQYIKHIIYNNI